MYPKETADALEAALQPLLGGEIITGISKHDTNPANNPQPPRGIVARLDNQFVTVVPSDARPSPRTSPP